MDGVSDPFIGNQEHHFGTPFTTLKVEVGRDRLVVLVQVRTCFSPQVNLNGKYDRGVFHSFLRKKEEIGVFNP